MPGFIECRVENTLAEILPKEAESTMKQSDFKRRIDAEIFDGDSDLDEDDWDDEEDEPIAADVRTKKPAVFYFIVIPLLFAVAVSATWLAKVLIVDGILGGTEKAMEEDVIGIWVENPEGEECYVTLLTKKTSDYGVFSVDDSIFHRWYGVNASLYLDALQQLCLDQGMSEQEAEEWVNKKKERLLIPGQDQRLQDGDNRYAYEMYYEIAKVYKKVLYKRYADEHVGTVMVSPKLYRPYEQWKVVAEYKDKDGYLFAIQQCKQIQGNGSASWKMKDFYLTEEFKVLIYWPKDGRFAVSKVFKGDGGEQKLTVKPGELVFENGVAEIP